MIDTPVDSLFLANRSPSDYLESNGEVSLRSSADESFRKVLLLAAASYFEHQVVRTILEYVVERTSDDPHIVELVRKKAIERQYHTYFDWRGNSANTFFGLFGSTFSDHMKALLKEDEEMRYAVRDFLELGNLRNQLVHQNFASFSLEKTVKEIYELYLSGIKFVDCLPAKLRDINPTV